MICGSLPAFIANPCDVVLVRMQADASLPFEKRRNYKNVIHGIQQIIKQESIAR